MFKLSNVGPQVIQNDVIFSIYLPSIKPPNFKVKVLYIKKEDQFNKTVRATPQELKYVNTGNQWGDIDECLWQSDSVHLLDGTYMYRYEIEGPAKNKSGNQVRSLYFSDPFVKETASGVFAVFHVGGNQTFLWNEPAGFKVPWIKDAIIYELNVAEFNYTFDGIVDRLPYLESLGVNVLELLPITGTNAVNDWAYTPLSYFAPEERFGGPLGLKRVVQECHKINIAVILDMVFPHSNYLFPYNIAYQPFFDLWFDEQYYDQQTAQLYRSPNPIVSRYFRFGQKNDFRMKSTKEFFKSVCEFWIDEYHIDGFRFDHVNGYLDKAMLPNDDKYNWDAYRPTFASLQGLTNDIYDFSKKYSRFQDASGSSRIIQIAEDLCQGSYQLSDNTNPITGHESAINGCWEEQLFSYSTDMAIWECLNGNYMNEIIMNDKRWDNFTGTKKVGQNKESIPVSPIIYNNCHDKSYLAYRIEKKRPWEKEPLDYTLGINQIPWDKTQPYAIALLTCVGTPMLFAGEEFAESYGLPENGSARTQVARFLHWDNFYTPSTDPNLPLTETVLPLTKLYRNLCSIRKTNAALRGPHSNAKREFEDFNRKIIVYSRWLDNEHFIVAINFSDQPATIVFPYGGNWKDVLDEYYNSTTPFQTGNKKQIDIPRNFGRILKQIP